MAVNCELSAPQEGRYYCHWILSLDDSVCWTLFLATVKRKTQRFSCIFVFCLFGVPRTSQTFFKALVFYLVLNLTLCFRMLAYYYHLLWACPFHQGVSFSSKKLCIFLCVIRHPIPSTKGNRISCHCYNDYILMKSYTFVLHKFKCITFTCCL